MALNSRFRDDVINEDFIRQGLVRHHKTSNLKLLDYKALPGSFTGDNYMGDLVSVEGEVELDGTKKRSFHWMAKLLKADPASGGQNIGRIMGVFKREAVMYKDIMPTLSKYGTINYCNFIFADESEGHEVLVLDHMGQHGWKTADNKKYGLSLKHVNLVMEWLARLHGLSYVMMKNYPGGIDAWRNDHPWSIPPAQNPPEIVEAFFELLKGDQKAKLLRIGEILEEENPEMKYVEKFTTFIATGLWITDLRKMAASIEGNTFNTLCHLDPWFNNMLFHYNSSQDPEEVLLLDFQLCGYTNPGNDLAYFLLTSTTPEFRSKHLESVLDLYHQTLHRVIRDAGIEKFDYSRDELASDYKKGLKLGIMLIIMALPLMINFDTNDTVDIGSVDLSDQDAGKAFEKLNADNLENLLAKNPVLKDRIKGVCDDLIREQII